MLSLDIAGLDVTMRGMASPILDIPALSIASGEQVAVTGGSGSGKTTFINIVTGLQKTERGRVSWDDCDLADLSEGARDRWRATHVGLVMQDFHLFPGLSALDNVLLPARLRRVADKMLVERARDLLATVGLSSPGQAIETMSRGEMQRVAIARAVLRRPAMIVADEPTASLDAASGQVVGDLLVDIADGAKATLIVVSHDPRLVERMKRRITLELGRIAADTPARKFAA